MTSTGAYPPGCTQRDVDMAAPGYFDEEEMSELDQVYEELSVALKGLRMRKDARADLIDLLERVVAYMDEKDEAEKDGWSLMTLDEVRILQDAKELLTRSWDDRY